MKITRDILSLTVVTLLVSFTPCLGAENKSDSVALQGKWQGFQNGQSNVVGTLSLSGKNLDFHSADGKEWYIGTFTLHEDSNPKQMIVAITESSEPKCVGKTANAIYRFENKTLTIAGNEPGNAAVPASFDAPGAEVIDFKKQ
jgi:uncharacterized protein (TIGR03067 family)